MFVSSQTRIVVIKVQRSLISLSTTLLSTTPIDNGIPVAVLACENLIIYSDISTNGGIITLEIDESFEVQSKTMLIHRSDNCKPHGISILEGDLIFSDPHNHQIKRFRENQEDHILDGNRKSGRAYGNAH